MKMFLFSALMLVSTVAFGDAAIFSGSDVKILKNNLDMNGKAKLLTGGVDPTAASTSAKAGSLYLNTSTGRYYRKLDSGSTLNWVEIGQLHPNINAIKNGDWETSSASWSASGGTYSRTTNVSQFAFGIGGGSWDSSAASQALTSDSITISGKYEGFKGQNGVAYCRIKGSSSGASHKIRVKTGSGTLNESTIYAPTDSFQRNSLNFVWPSSGSAAIELESVASNEPEIFIDDCYLGLADNLKDVAQASLYGEAIWPAASLCQWTRSANNDLTADFAADADCVFPSGSNLRGRAKAPSTKIPAITFDYLEPGYYLFIANGLFYKNNTANNACMYSVADGITTFGGGTNAVYAGGAEAAGSVIVNSWVYTSARTNVTFSIRASAQSAVQACGIYNDDLSQLSIKVYRFPLETELSYRPDIINWHIDANIGGANPSLGTSSVSSYTEITNGSLDLVPRTGSLPVGIACANGNVSSVGATTCPSSNESLGITFNVPRAGKYKACVQFSHTITTGPSFGDGGGGIFQLIKTASNSSTIIEEGGGKQEDESITLVASNLEHYFPFNLCGTFNATSAGQQTVRLMYEQLISGTISNSLIAADRNGVVGQRDTHWTVYPIDQQIPSPLLVGGVITPSSGVEKLVRVTTAFCNSSPCTISSQNDGVSTVTRSGTGSYVVNFLNSYSSAPTCTCSTLSSTNNSWCQGFSTASTFNAFTLSNSSTTVDEGIHVLCMGPK